MSDGYPRQHQNNRANPTELDTDQDRVLVRSEELLSVGLDIRVSERVTVRKRVVTETVTQVIERRREELVVERHPTVIDSNDRSELALAGARGSEPFTDTDSEIVLFEEQIMITKQIVPVERIHLGTRTVVDVVEVSDDVRREQIDLITDPTPPTTTGRAEETP